MDPEATYAILVDDERPLDERAEAALNLLVWIAKGGTISLYVEGMRPTLDTIERCEATLCELLDRPLPLDMDRYV